MPRPRRYPFDQLAIGQRVTVTDVPSAHAARMAKHTFQLACRDIGYQDGELPQFLLSYDPTTRVLTITRLPDGTVLPRGRPANPLSAHQKRLARAVPGRPPGRPSVAGSRGTRTRAIEALDHDVQEYMRAQAARHHAGHPVDLMPAQALSARAQELRAGWIASALADFLTDPQFRTTCLAAARDRYSVQASKDCVDALQPAQP